MNSKKSNNEGQFVKTVAEVQLGLWLGRSAKDSSLGTLLGPGLRRQVVMRTVFIPFTFTCAACRD